MAIVLETALVAAGTGMVFAVTPVAAPAVEDGAAGPAQAQDEVSAVLMARLQNRNIEVLGDRTEDSSTWALPSGALQTEAFAGPVRVRQDGVWEDIDTSLSDAGPALEPQAAAADIKVSDGGDTSLASVTKGDESFGLGWQNQLPDPQVKGSTASYGLGTGQSLSVTALAQGFSENITLAQALDTTPVYRIPLDLHGLTMSQAASGHLLLKDDSGQLVAEAPAPMMWDSTKDPVSGEPEHTAPVAASIDTAADGSQTLVLTPDPSFLATATYPVTVDPTSTLAVTTDTWVQTPDYPDSQVSSTELKSGTYDGGTDVARSYLQFNVAPFVGKHIIDTNLSLYSYYSSTCSTSGAGTQVRRITSSWSSSSVTWSTQPSTTTTDAVTNKAALGFDSSCPGGTMNFDIDGIVQAWASGSANDGLQVRAASETDSFGWRRFRSANYVSGDNSVEPHLTVTYNSYPTTAGGAISPSVVDAYNGRRYLTSLTPTLSAKVTDADGSSVKGQFEITPDPAFTDTTYTYTGTSASVASGSTAKLTVPSASALPATTHERFRVRGYDGTDYGPWSGYTVFSMNTGLPAAPAISCGTYTQNTWTAAAGSAVNCTLDTSAGDGEGYYWGLDDPSAPKRVDDTVDGFGGDPLTVSINPANGWHTLYAKTVDSGGNVSSSATAYSFGVGADGAALLTPAQGDTTARRVNLTSTGKSTYTGVTYQYRRGETDTWTNVPTVDVTKTSDGSAVSSWPVPATGGAPAALTWNIADTLSADGPVDIRAAFTDGTTTGYSQANTVTIDRNAGTAPSEDVGPGQVNDLTGDFTLSATDASGLGMDVSRTESSRRPTAGSDEDGNVAIFGPQWTSGTTAELTDSDWAYIQQTSATSVGVFESDGDQTGFTATTGGGWKPEPGAEDLTLTGSLTGSFTLKDEDGTTTTFTKPASAVPTWQVSATFLPTSNSTTTVVSQAVTVGAMTLARPHYVIAPTSAVSAATCQTTPSTAGCRMLEFVYATSTTAASSTFGDYTGRVSQIKEWTTAPGATTATATVVAQYAYDTVGNLRQEWDPRISPALKTAYTYDTAGRVITQTPPGELPWTFTYGNVGTAATAGDGMLLSASRPTLTPGTAATQDGGTATTSVVYNVPLTGSNAPYSMGAADVAAWGQQDVPADATAVFPADSVPSSHVGSGLTAASYQRAGVTYTDASGREVNDATPGGHITATEYDRFGNTVRQLTASNRDLALATSGSGLDELTLLGIDNLSTADRAQQLSTASVYSSDGLRETDEYGPLHQVTLASALTAGTGGTNLPAGSQIAARQHTSTSYDQGRPTDGTATVVNQPTTVQAGAYVAGYPADGDVTTTDTSYDWVKGLPTSTTTDPGGLALTRTTGYDAQGRIIKTTLPKSTGTDADTTITTYYAATGTGTCNGHPEWADFVCQTGPAGAITGGGTNPSQLPTKTLQYDKWGNTSVTTETANSITRTTTNTYDAASRLSTTAVAGGTGTTVPDSTTTYTPDSGDVATVTSNGQTITHTYDALGREISYNDGAGNTATTSYDKLDRPVSTTDSAPSTTTYTYDTSTDPRGLETSRTDSFAGTFTATYDADGGLATEALPGGYTLTVTKDEAGNETSRVYTRDSDSTVVASDNVGRDILDRAITDTDSNGQTRARAYTYDAAGRLTGADDTAPDNSCTRRTYGYDDNTNRTSLAVSTVSDGSGCSSTGTTTTSTIYDSADRLETTGTVYDAFGRTTTEASGATNAYYANDLVRQQTSGATRQTWTLDAAGRLAAWSTEDNSSGTWTQTASNVNHYGTDGDAPDWVQETATAITRNVEDLDGGLAATTNTADGVVLQLTDVHGDATVHLPLDPSLAPAASSYDEFGNSQDDTAAARYGWLGAKERSTQTPTGAILMGVRLYDPQTGRFLSSDPVAGGSANAYDYANADPVNQYDLGGQATKKPAKLSKEEEKALTDKEDGRPYDRKAYNRARKKIIQAEKYATDGRNAQKNRSGSHSLRSVLKGMGIFGSALVLAIAIAVAVELASEIFGVIALF